MPISNLFAISNKGRVFALQTDRARWEELPYLGIDFKAVSAHDSVVWALGGDHQIYVYVYGTSVPIRVCEESYENERWNPLEGFTSNLLPTDRPHFSSSDGCHSRDLTSIHLPSLAWNWEAPWQLQDTFDGKALNKECWTYAIDFPRSYSAEKNWRSCVRRRKWVRFRRYVALDTWSAVSAIHNDYTEEPFIAVTVGGGDVVGEDADKLMVWSVSAFGRVFVREGVSACNPEGDRWIHVETPANQDVTSISISRCGRVWALTWDGSVLVRCGVSRDNPVGCAWSRVEAPGIPLKQFSVGQGVVWAVGRDFSLWFRKGLISEDNSDVGTSWMVMFGSLVECSVGPNNQVWGITADENSIVVRTGVTPSEPPGKTWKIINLPLRKFHPDRPLSCTSGAEFDSDSSCNSPSTFSEDFQSKKHLTSETPLNSMSSCDSSDAKVLHCSGSYSPSEAISSSQINIENTIKASHNSGSAASDHSLLLQGVSAHILKDGRNTEKHFSIRRRDSAGVSTLRDSLNELNLISDVSLTLHDKLVSNSSIKTNQDSSSSSIEQTAQSKSLFVPLTTKASPSSHRKIKFGLESPSKSSAYSNMSVSRNIESTSSSPGSEIFSLTVKQSNLSQEECPHFEVSLPEDNLWMSVSGNGCWFNPCNMPKWFLADYSAYFDHSRPWRSTILAKLILRRQKEFEPFENYQEAVECSSWIVIGQCRFLVSGQWFPASIELNMAFGDNGAQKSYLKIIYLSGSHQSIVISAMSIVLCSLTIDLPAKAALSLHTPAKPLSPFILLFSTEKDAEEWFHRINLICINISRIGKKVNARSMWAVTHAGYIYYCNYSISNNVSSSLDSTTRHLVDGRTLLPFLHHLNEGFGPGCSLIVEGKILDEADRFRIDLLMDSPDNDVAFHFNPRFADKTIVMNSKEHDIWSCEEKQPLKYIYRGKTCQLIFSCDDNSLNVFINGTLFHVFSHRFVPLFIRYVRISGDLQLNKVLYHPPCRSRSSLASCRWVGVGGHLRSVELGAYDIVWGISYDRHVYVHEGLPGGGVFGAGFSDPKMTAITDVRHFHVWENERWNPIFGFGPRSRLPTDRYQWSDGSGRHERTKESTKLPSRHWHWIGDFNPDHHVPGGCDQDGWQYASDFPMTFHGNRYVTDLVRRRRWIRKARVNTLGPWTQLAKVTLNWVSVSPEVASDGTVPVWGVSASGEVVMREGVTAQCPGGVRWSLVSSGVSMKEICAGVKSGVWAVSVNGLAHLRIGVTEENPKGRDWVNIEAPAHPLVQVCSGGGRVFALDCAGCAYYRCQVQPLFPEGTAWTKFAEDLTRISVGIDGSLFAIQRSREDSGGKAAGALVKRTGISEAHPGGLDWEVAAGNGWSNISARLPPF